MGVGREEQLTGGEEKLVTTTCSSHCGGRCIVKVHVRDGVITRIESDDGEEPQLRACLRGRAYRQRVYSPDRLKFPLRRAGDRGKGRFDRITWDEALDTVSRELMRIKDAYGPAAILLVGSGGDCASLHGYGLIDRLVCMMGGCTKKWGSHSHEGGDFASLATYSQHPRRSA